MKIAEFPRSAVRAGVAAALTEDREEVTRMRAGRSGGSEIVLEASGNVTPDRVRAIADAGVDLISIGVLTHSAPALDPTMLITMEAAPCPR